MALYRKVIQIKGVDSPNVRLALAQREAGLTPTGENVVPGVLSWRDYIKRRATWDDIRQCIGLDAEFYEGREVLLFPPLWLNRAEEIARRLKGQARGPYAMGVDPAEGGDKTTMYVVDELGVVEMSSQKTPDTNDIPNLALAFIRKYKIDPSRVCFDRGGGGKQAADRLRSQGCPVRTVAFGEPVSPEIGVHLRRRNDKVDAAEDRYVYKNRRAELYGELRRRLDPAREAQGHPGFAIPAHLTVLRKELAPIPLLFDAEGRLELPPKHRKAGQAARTAGTIERKTLVELIGHSPDEADALALAVYAMSHAPTRSKVRVLGRVSTGSNRKRRFGGGRPL